MHVTTKTRRDLQSCLFKTPQPSKVTLMATFGHEQSRHSNGTDDHAGKFKACSVFIFTGEVPYLAPGLTVRTLNNYGNRCTMFIAMDEGLHLADVARYVYLLN